MKFINSDDDEAIDERPRSQRSPHAEIEAAIRDLREGEAQILEAIGILTSRVADLDEVASKLARPTWIAERSQGHSDTSPHLDVVGELRRELDDARAALTEERRRTHSDWRALNQTSADRWKFAALILVAALTGSGGTKLFELIFK